MRLLVLFLSMTLVVTTAIAKEVVHYSFDEGTGTTIHDSSPLANHGSLSSSSLWSAPGYDDKGYCIQLPGYSSTQYASIPHNNEQNFDGIIHLGAWVKPQPSGNTLDPIFCKGSSNVPYGLDIYNGKLWFLGNYQTGGTGFNAASTGTVPYGEWSHVGVAYDQKNVTFYINGKKAGQTPMNVPIVNNSQPMYIGIDKPGYTEKYNGKIDEVVINNMMSYTPELKPRQDPIPSSVPTNDALRNAPVLSIAEQPHVSSSTGMVNIMGTGFSMQTGSPVWMTTLVETDDFVNFLTFEADFMSDPRAEGLLAVYWNNELLGQIDERYVLDGMQEYALLLPDDFGTGVYPLSFRLDPYTDTASSVMIDNVATGFAVPEPASLILLSIAFLAFSCIVARVRTGEYH